MSDRVIASREIGRRSVARSIYCVQHMNDDSRFIAKHSRAFDKVLPYITHKWKCLNSFSLSCRLFTLNAFDLACIPWTASCKLFSFPFYSFYFPIFCLLFWWLTEHLSFRRNRKCWIIQYSCSSNWISIFFIFIFPLCVCVCARCFSFVYSTFWLTIRILVMSLLYKWSWWWWWFEPLQTKRIRI